MGLEGFDHLGEQEREAFEARVRARYRPQPGALGASLDRAAADSGRDRGHAERIFFEREELRMANEAAAKMHEAQPARDEPSERQVGSIGESINRAYQETCALAEIVQQLEERLESVLRPEEPHLAGSDRGPALTSLGEHIEQIADQVDVNVRRLMMIAMRIQL